jgi:formylglycine-generating enzyme required for sulfatase activity
MQIGYDSLPCSGKADKARELILFCQRHNRYDELVKTCQELRPLAFESDSEGDMHESTIAQVQVVPLQPPEYDTIPVTLVEWQESLAQRNELFGQPASYWCYVRPGTYRIGGWEEGEPAANITLDAFWVARFPITVAQYVPFVEVGYSLGAQCCWTPNGWKWKVRQNRLQPQVWNFATHSINSNQSVTGVTWYEAVAFTAWLTEQLQNALPSGYVIRLPTEAEWEVAAAYDAYGQRRIYPWGAEPLTLSHAVYDRKWQTCPPHVGSCPAGAAACGALDMVGTVWEPTASSFAAYPNQGHSWQEDFTSDKWNVPWRGGAYGNDSTYIQCGSRYRGHPGDAFGFRMLFAPRLRKPLIAFI